MSVTKAANGLHRKQATPGTIYRGFAWINSKLGVAKSIDGGATWSFPTNGLTGASLVVQSIALNPRRATERHAIRIFKLRA